MKTKVLFLSGMMAICTSLNVDAQIFKQVENAVTQKAANALENVLNGKRAKTGNQNTGRVQAFFPMPDKIMISYLEHKFYMRIILTRIP